MKIPRRGFLRLGGGAAFAWPLSAHAQQAAMPRVGFLGPADDAAGRSDFEAFLRAFQILGWTDGHNVRLDVRWGAGDRNRLAAYATELVSLKPEVILVASAPAIAALLRETQSIPIVFANASDPVGAGFITSLSRPGGNLTGFVNFEFAMGGKWVEILKEIDPSVTRAALVLNPDNPSTPGQLEAIGPVASSLGVKLSPADVRDTFAVHEVLTAFAEKPNGGLIVMPTVFNSANRQLIIALAAKHGLPAVYPFRYFVDDGGLISYGIVVPDLYRRSAVYVDRILRGEKAGDLPVQTPTKYELAINLKTAKALGLEIPTSILLRADEVIE